MVRVAPESQSGKSTTPDQSRGLAGRLASLGLTSPSLKKGYVERAITPRNVARVPGNCGSGLKALRGRGGVPDETNPLNMGDGHNNSSVEEVI
ncbi:MAG: hypothetical protein AB1700_00040 [Bacillota bacterium]